MKAEEESVPFQHLARCCAGHGTRKRRRATTNDRLIGDVYYTTLTAFIAPLPFETGPLTFKYLG